MTPTPQQIRSQTYQLDRVADALADLEHAPLSESVVTIRTVSARLNKLANGLPTTPAPTPHKLKFGFVANAAEVKLVKQLGCKFARVQGWPGGAKDIVTAFGQGVDVSIRIAREAIGTTSKALEPLTTEALRHAMIAQITADVSIYKQHGVTSIILGNEPDGTRGGKPRYWTGKIDRFGTDWARFIAPIVRAAGIRVGFGLPIFPSADAKFAGDLIASGAYQVGDFFAANVYGANAIEHHQRRQSHAVELSFIPSFNPDTDFEISEAGLQRGGPADAWVSEFEKTIDTYQIIKFPGAVYAYRIDENSEAPFAPFKDGKPTSTIEQWKRIAA